MTRSRRSRDALSNNRYVEIMWRSDKVVDSRGDGEESHGGRHMSPAHTPYHMKD